MGFGDALGNTENQVMGTFTLAPPQASSDRRSEELAADDGRSDDRVCRSVAMMRDAMNKS